MAFNFMSGQQSYDPFSPYQQSFYNDPRRRGAQGSFNPYALSNFGATEMNGGMMPPQKYPPPPMTPPAPQVPTVPPTPTPTPTPPPTPIPANKPGYSGSGSGSGSGGGNTGAINYGQYGSVQEVYANNPQGLPAGWDWAAWAQATGQQNPMMVTAAGDPVRFTWNPNGPGFIDPYTGETFDKPGETYPMPPQQQRAPYTPPTMPNFNFGGLPRG